MVSADSNLGPGNVYPGGPGMGVRQVNGQRTVDAMTWGFPLRLKGMKPDMVMTEACIHVADVHDRMPVILRRDDRQDWLDGAPDDARTSRLHFARKLVPEPTLYILRLLVHD